MATTITYERFAPQDPTGQADPEHGIRQFVVGTGGAEHYRVERATTSAKLRLYATSATANRPAVYLTSDEWSEEAVTWDTRPPHISNRAGDADHIEEMTWIEFDVTRLIKKNGAYNIVLASNGANIQCYATPHRKDGLR